MPCMPDVQKPAASPLQQATPALTWGREDPKWGSTSAVHGPSALPAAAGAGQTQAPTLSPLLPDAGWSRPQIEAFGILKSAWQRCTQQGTLRSMRRALLRNSSRPPVATTMGTPAAAAVCSAARVPEVRCCCGLSSVPSTSLQTGASRARQATGGHLLQMWEPGDAGDAGRCVTKGQDLQPEARCTSKPHNPVAKLLSAHLTISSTFLRPLANSSAVALSSVACGCAA